MMFDPLDPATWKDDPEDFVVPKHELESTLETAEADAEEQAQARVFYWDDETVEFGPSRMPKRITDFGGSGFKEGVQKEALQQIIKGQRAKLDAIQAGKDVAEAVRQRDPVLAQIEELKAQMRKPVPKRWRWLWNKMRKEAQSQ